MKGEITIPIPGELESVAIQGVVAPASAIYDYSLKKNQETINLTIATLVEAVSGIEDNLGLVDLNREESTFNLLKPEVDAYLKNVHYNNFDLSSFVSDYMNSSYNSSRLDQPFPVQILSNNVMNLYSDFFKTSTQEAYSPSGGIVSIYNLIPGNKYFTLNSIGEVRSIKIAPGRRFIFANRYLNVRDLGGIPVSGGGYIAYDKIIRGPELNNKTTEVFEDSITYLKNLKFSQDIDLRRLDEINETDYTPLCYSYTRKEFFEFEDIASMTDDKREMVKSLINLILERLKHNRKIYIHCAWGFHRAGLLCAIIEGILGASLSDIDKDYELSSFSSFGSAKRSDYPYSTGIKALNNIYGGSWTKFALDCGVSLELIDELRNIMVVGSSQQEKEVTYLKVTYKLLVDLKNRNLLIPGTKYHMIDYDTYDGILHEIASCSGITNLMDFKSAYHPFDLLLTAISTNEFDSNVKALHSIRDTKEYFTEEDLSKWEIKYDLDNDSSKYSWAVPNGKGVIYYMKDEHNNEAPYDFKNIMFKYDGYWYYTFPATLNNPTENIIIKPWIDNLGQHLNGNIFIGNTNHLDNGITIMSTSVIKNCFLDFNTHDNIMKSDIINVKIGKYSSNNTLVNLDSVILGLDNINIYLEDFVNSTIGNECYNLKLYGNNNVIIVEDFVSNKTGFAINEYTKIYNNIEYSPVEENLDNITKIYYTNGDKKLIKITGQLIQNKLPDFNNIKEVEIGNSVTSIGNSAFYNCTGLKSITIPNSVTTIDSYAFQGCSGLTSITIPNGVTSIGGHAFYYCTSLTSITIQNSVTSIGGQAFKDCSSLTSVVIGSGVTSISDEAFSGCTSLTSVVIGSGVTSIKNYAFYNCSNLTSFICLPVTPPTFGYGSIPYNIEIIKVPAQSVDVYKSASGWSNYANKIVAIQL